ncbi:uncharacterized protein LOC123683949 [Harmonia axyridis]|uniref:uncharacterized protein LOC123683949 n=1 Tax=Harmonia axyridis TaxID=115357 RepID=UPI001E2752F9|nr:uncharacterized protein LOC123683949 [Harmonia axyridis]
MMFNFLFVILLIERSLGENAEEINSKLTSDPPFGFNVSESQVQNSSIISVNTDVFVSTSVPSTQNVHVIKAVEIGTNNTLYKKAKGNDEFRPSPEVKELTFERNIVPVKPAYAEAKHTSLNVDEQFGKSNSPWETTWNPANFRFPETKVPTAKDRPYKFEENRGRTFGFSGKNDYDSASDKPLINLGAKIPISASGGGGTGIGGAAWDIGGYSYPSSNRYLPKKPSYGYEYGGYIEKPPTGIEHHGGHEYPVKKYDNPWKKIIKIIAAFIPIGLLISALTPTIITVSPVNATMTRSRDEDTHSSTIKKLVSSLGYFNQLDDKDCENRLLCELILSASSSQNAELHIENFLNNFSNRGKYTTEREEELKMIFDSVKKQRCNEIICKGIRDYT